MQKLITYNKEREEMKQAGKKLIGLSTNPFIEWDEGVILLRVIRSQIDDIIKSLEKEPS